jgi:hypothetical protein
MPIETLIALQYSQDRKGPFQLYIYEPNSEYHRGGVWFENKPKYPEEEITTEIAQSRVWQAMTEKREVRICDGGDMLVFHAKDGRIIYPPKPADFWEEVSKA